MISSKFCLLVEDDPEDQEFFIDALHKISADVGCYVVANGEEALNALIEKDLMPDFIFTDLEMPVMNGFDFIKRLRAIERYRTVPVIIYTSSFAAEHINHAQSLNVTAIYSKTRISALKDILQKYFAVAPDRNVIL